MIQFLFAAINLSFTFCPLPSPSYVPQDLKKLWWSTSRSVPLSFCHLSPPPLYFPSSRFLPPFFYMVIAYLTPTGSLAWIFHSTRVCISTPRRVRIYLPSVGSNLSPSPNDFASVEPNVFISDDLFHRVPFALSLACCTGFRTSEQAHGGQQFRRNHFFWRGCSTSLYFQQQATSVLPTICRRCVSLTSSRRDGYGWALWRRWDRKRSHAIFSSSW